MFLLVSIKLTGIANLRHLFFCFCLYRTYGDRSSLYFCCLISVKLTGISDSAFLSLYGTYGDRQVSTVKFSKSSELTGIAALFEFITVSLHADVL